MQDTATDQFLKAEELARKLNCGKSTVYRLAKSGKIPCIVIGDTGVRFELQAVLAKLRRKSG